MQTVAHVLSSIVPSSLSSLDRLARSDAAPRSDHGFELKFGFQTFEIAMHKGRGELLAVSPTGDRAVSVSERAIDFGGVPVLGMSDTGETEIILLRPKERDGIEPLSMPRMFGRLFGPDAPRLRNAPDGYALLKEGLASGRYPQRRRCEGHSPPDISSTSTPRSMARPACWANPISGRTPMPRCRSPQDPPREFLR